MYKLFFLLFFAALITSCNTDTDTGNFVVGSDYLALNNNVLLIDTLSVDVATIQLDSLVTSGQSRVLVGYYVDPIFGKIQSDSYFQLYGTSYSLYSDYSDTESSNYVFDSIRMVMKLDKYYYGDTTKSYSFSIHRLNEKVKATLEDGTFHNDSKLSYDSNSLGNIVFKPKPNSQDSVNVVLDDVFGEALFQKIKKKEITSSDEFTEYLKGFVIKASTDNSSSVMGFNLSSELRMYYSKYLSTSETSYVMNFGILSASNQFNNIFSDKSNTLLQNLPTGTAKLSSTSTANKAFIQSGSGVACRIDFPNIKQLKYLYDKNAIVDAELTIKPVNTTYSNAYPLPDSLQVYIGDNLNRIKGTLTTAAGTPIYAILNNSNDEFNETTAYKISIGAFLQSEMIKESDSKYSLILAIPNVSKAVNRVVLADQKTKSNTLKLKIYYISY
ncbi:hypothetical protein HNP99_000294 [Flavobacterium sp. 28A]|uniref:DUF4270 family protein n=1 Tax=Flavobacterium sp. 28A TaxID=2735895 RepID=UPI00156E5CF7|nr:DUF4270 family protein [Flavobacterium sp. 28A]NRT13969.1 hypothetical protein [Flavobacterium sp. 28A]